MEMLLLERMSIIRKFLDFVKLGVGTDSATGEQIKIHCFINVPKEEPIQQCSRLLTRFPVRPRHDIKQACE